MHADVSSTEAHAAEHAKRAAVQRVSASKALFDAACARIRAVAEALRANMAETLLVPLITEQGGKDIQHEEYEDILSGAVGRAQ